MRFARRNSAVRLLLVGQAFALVLFTLVVPIEVIYAKESLGTSDAGFGILLASWGAGIVIGSLVYLLIKQRSPLGLIVFSNRVARACWRTRTPAGAEPLALPCHSLDYRASSDP